MKVEVGDLWQLGDHRLLVGDSTVKANAERLFAGEVPTLMVTDPPYGVKYEPSWRSEHLGPVRLTGVVANDDRADWTEAWEHFPGDIIYCWHAGLQSAIVQASLEGAGFQIRSQIIWAKKQFAISRGHYHWKHEVCFYAVRKGKTAQWAGNRKQNTLWEIRPSIRKWGRHSTQKPVECMQRPMLNHHAAIIYDPFLGSGTTISAAEQINRRCFGMEIDPEYAATIIERWETETGKQGLLLERM